jgi:hypothetical protein
MTQLKNQPTKLPTRKILAVIVSGAILGGVQSALAIFWPDHPFMGLMEQADIWIQAGVMVLAGYLTREKEDA